MKQYLWIGLILYMSGQIHAQANYKPGDKAEGGIVVFSKNGHGLVIAEKDLDVMGWEEANIALKYANIGGYTNWRLPVVAELDAVRKNLIQQGLASTDFPKAPGVTFWTSNQQNNRKAYSYNLPLGIGGYANKTDARNIRPVREF